MHVLVTGGAGFIGSHIVDALLQDGHTVRILDSLEEQIHQGQIPTYLHEEVELIHGDVRDKDCVSDALKGINSVIHCVAMTGAGQSQYDIARYTDINATGTAVLIDAIVNSDIPLEHFVLPSSMMVYGEGAYRCAEHGVVHPRARSMDQLEHKDWKMYCPTCNSEMESIAIDETLSRQPETLYGLSKAMQEDLVLNAHETHGLPGTILRLFNVYGTRQSLKNPYTGVIAVFLSRLNLGKTPLVYEDGKMTRDFTSVRDVVAAFQAALKSNPGGEVYNIGTGHPQTIFDLAHTLAKVSDSDLIPEVSGMSYKNHILHSQANPSKAKEILGWEAEVDFSEGIKEVIAWANTQEVTDESDTYNKELEKSKLLIQAS